MAITGDYASKYVRVKPYDAEAGNLVRLYRDEDNVYLGSTPNAPPAWYTVDPATAAALATLKQNENDANSPLVFDIAPPTVEPEAPRGIELPRVVEQPTSGTVRSILSYGAVDGADSRAAIQAALDASSPGDTVHVPRGTYLLSSAGANPHDAATLHCLNLPSGVTLHISPGGMLKLADGQQTTTVVNILVFSGDDITITGGGTIIGNTSGQTTWAGGYSQITNGCAIRGYAPSNRIKVTDLHIHDTWSNPVYIIATDDVELARLVTTDFGEGVQVGYATNVRISDIFASDTRDVSTGDAVEIAYVNHFSIARVYAIGPGAGSAIDVFGSKYGVVEDITIQGWRYGLEIQDTFDGTPVITTDVKIRRVKIRGAYIALQSAVTQGGFNMFEDITILDCEIGIRINGNDAAYPVSVKRGKITTLAAAQQPGFGYGVIMVARRTLILESVLIDGVGNYGVRIANDGTVILRDCCVQNHAVADLQLVTANNTVVVEDSYIGSVAQP